MTNSLRLLLLLIAFFVVVQLAALGIFPALPDPGFGVRAGAGASVVINHVRPGSGAQLAGLHSGTIIRSIDHEKVDSVRDFMHFIRMEATAGTLTQVTVQEAGGRLRVVSIRMERRSLHTLLIWIIVTVLALYFFTGAYLLYARWSDPTARWFGLAMTGVGNLNIDRFFHMLWMAWLTRAGIPLDSAAARAAWLPAALLMAALLPGIAYCIFRFMRRMGTVELEADWLDRIFLSLAALTGLAGFVQYSGEVYNWSSRYTASVYESLIGTLFVLTVVVGFRIRNRLKGRVHLTPRMIRQYRFLRTGTLISFLPALPFLFVHLLWPNSTADHIAGLAGLSVGLWPIFVAYSITRYRMFGFRRVMRKSLQYALLSGGIGVFFLGLILLLLWQAGRDSGRPEFIGDIVLLSGVIVAARIGSPRLHHQLDRRFFREAWTAEDILGRLGTRIGHFFQMEDLQRYVLAQLDSALHMEWAAIYARGENAHGVRREIFARSLPFDLPERLSIDREGLELTSPLVIEPDEDTPVSRRPWTNAEVVVPLRSQERLLGWLLLGAKMSQEPYSRRDLKLLAAVGSQLAISMSGIHLLEEVRKRDRIQQEMQLAREVQLRLLPQRLPRVEGIEIAATYAPAREVGGDYYDVFEAVPGIISIVLADVSGKGVSAALLMANLQAVVHGLHGAGSVSERMERMNHQLLRSVPTGQYVTMCYCEYDSARHTLTYTNAGHEPPLLLRAPAAGGGRLRTLRAGGTVLGLFPDSRYPSETLQLNPGDTLILFTDGVTDAINPEGLRFERERLESVALKLMNAQAGPDRMVHQIREWVMEFSRGQAQFDDLTMLALQVVPVPALPAVCAVAPA